MVKKMKGEQAMDIKPVNQINFDFNGTHYCLEYTPKSISVMESWNFDINDLERKPQTRVEQIWNGALLEHHRKVVGDGKAMDIYRAIKNKEALLEKLAEMYKNALAYLTEDDEGNVEWTATM